MSRCAAAGRTSRGRVRKTNEDAFRIYLGEDRLDCPDRGSVFVVADGIGSYRAGGQAASIVVDQLALFFNLPDDNFEGSQTLEKLLFRANEVITSMRTGQKGYYGMGCTVTALHCCPDYRQGTFYQSGDSMAYLLRGGRLAAVTTPQRAEEDGALLNHVGLGDRFALEKIRVALRPGDTILLCSDGLHGPLDEARLVEGLGQSQAPGPCLDHLMAMAERLGDDNVTGIVLKVVPLERQSV